MDIPPIRPLLDLEPGDFLQAELEGVTGEVILGDPQVVCQVLRFVMEEAGMVLERLDPPGKPALTRSNPVSWLAISFSIRLIRWQSFGVSRCGAGSI
jgi:hypothetical protein